LEPVSNEAEQKEALIEQYKAEITTNTQLPAEVLEDINVKAEIYANVQHGSKDKFTPAPASWEDSRDDYIAGATEYATNLHQAGKDRQYAYEEMTKARSCFNDARTLLEKLVSNKHAFILPQQIENEIKTFLDGTK
jgi:hypothetical protein